jgi:amidophosphoribosyltransferase
MSTKKELIAAQKTVEEIRKELGVDSLTYQNHEGLLNALVIQEKDLCLACLNGKYPTKAGKENCEKDEKRVLSC